MVRSCEIAGWGTSLPARTVRFAGETRYRIDDETTHLDMLAEAGVGIAYNAKPVVQLEAPATLNRPGLDGVLLLLGIARDTWASPGESPRP